MPREKVLITVKTYPVYSRSYDELVCTAGFREDGSFIRIYPMPFRKLEYDSRFKKFQWIELDLVRNTSDFRPESYRPGDIDKIKTLEFIDTDKGTWERRKELCLSRVYEDMTLLISEAKDRNTCTSLAVFKPTEITGFDIEEAGREWKREEEILISRDQLELFPGKRDLEIVKKLPYNFYYRFTDKNGKESRMMVSDWEAGSLYWNCLEKHKDEQKACLDVQNKYIQNFGDRDIYFFLGTTKEFHFTSKNPFIIIGVFYPKADEQGRLF
ncbi:MAG: hypothetical protein CVV44_11885 [Spirochaetae bacterium HGW-Spirochaetae-1]|jgi:hypothetical protein|nr:MAG: hypothetical protein CVV44_11885 [Spirochaetae bacterium HGW-Spirochaetae-1]